MKAQSGYTLLETVVAFAILALSLGALFESFSTAVARSEKSRNASRAELIASSVRDRLGADIPLTATASEGSFDEDCSWNIRSTAVARKLDRPPTVRTYDVRIEVACGSAGARGRAELSTAELATAN